MQIVVSAICLIYVWSTVLTYPIKTVIIGDDDTINITTTCSNWQCHWTLGSPLSNNYKNVTSSPLLTLNGSALQVHDYGVYYLYDSIDIRMALIVRPTKGEMIWGKAN